MGAKSKPQKNPWSKSSKTNLVILHLQNYMARGYVGATTNLQIVPSPKKSQNGRFQTQKNPLIIPMT